VALRELETVVLRAAQPRTQRPTVFHANDRSASQGGLTPLRAAQGRADLVALLNKAGVKE